MSISDYLYLIHLRESIKCNENIYKVGRTQTGPDKRIKNYPKGSNLIAQFCVTDAIEAEAELLKLFDSKYIQVKDYGREYYKGDKNQMKDDLYQLSKKYENKPKQINQQEFESKLSTYISELLNTEIKINYEGEFDAQTIQTITLKYSIQDTIIPIQVEYKPDTTIIKETINAPFPEMIEIKEFYNCYTQFCVESQISCRLSKTNLYNLLKSDYNISPVFQEHKKYMQIKHIPDIPFEATFIGKLKNCIQAAETKSIQRTLISEHFNIRENKTDFYKLITELTDAETITESNKKVFSFKNKSKTVEMLNNHNLHTFLSTLMSFYKPQD